METELASIGISKSELTSIFRLIDRRDKLPDEKWEAYAIDLGLQAQQIEQLQVLLNDQALWQKSASLSGLFPAVEALGASEYVQFAPHVIRGLDYYTGTVFEAQAVRGGLKRSILGGGRYNNLLSDVGGNEIPAVGFAMGDLVITLVLEELGLIPAEIKSPPAAILVTIFSEETTLESLSLANELREAGIKVNCYPQADRLGKQLKYGDRAGIKIAVLLGPDEIDAQQVTLKDLGSGSQQTVARSHCAGKIAELLEDNDSS
jgi:histidyl-tRNA synthetase